MNRVGSWLYGRKTGNELTPYLEMATQIQDIEQAMQAATLFLNDDIEGAELGLSKGDSTFHKTGKGVVSFLRALLGFEPEIMREASERLSDAENSAYNDQQKVLHSSGTTDAFHSKIYDAGTEYALCQAMAQNMFAAVGVLSENLTESLKGFYKMKKAFTTLDAIVRMEERYLETLPLSKSRTAPASLKSGQDISRDIAGLDLANKCSNTPASAPASSPSTPTEALAQEMDSTDVFSHPIDAFIHTGASMCMGMLLTMLATLPPAFGRLLAIVGFRGDKERGLRMLWQATKAENLVGAVAALGILAYFNGFIRPLDIIPDVTSDDESEVEGYPMGLLLQLINTMRARYPNSQLWYLEEARMKSVNRDLQGGLKMLLASKKSPLKQVEALQMFERSMNSMYLHRYEDCGKYFIECANLNSWSPSLYYYIAGSAYVVLYREAHPTDPALAENYAEKAREYLRKAPTLAGKKRLMSRKLPFEVYLIRKVARWEARAREKKIDLVDAVGVDPIEEMIFIWNGYNRMNAAGMEESLGKLEWSRNELSKHNDEDEKAIIDLNRAAILRALGKYDEAKEILKHEVLAQEKSVFKGNLRDNWVLPAAHYEMAANLWMERANYVSTHISPFADPAAPISQNGKQQEGVGDSINERQKVKECDGHLEKAAKWESYELDTRIGLKVTAARDAVRKWYASHGDDGRL